MVLRKLHFASSALLHCLKKKSVIFCALCVIKTTRKNICFILRNRAHLKSKAKMSPTSGDWAWKPSVAVKLTPFRTESLSHRRSRAGPDTGYLKVLGGYYGLTDG